VIVVASSVAGLAAAWLTVRPGCSRCGYWATPQPHAMAATASAAVTRTRMNLRATRSASDAAPAAPDTATSGSARPDSPAYSRGASACTTAMPMAASTPAATPVPSARRRNSSASPGSPARRASAVR
jgi:hypothetical protein